MRAHIQKNQIPTRRSGKKRLLKILTSRLFIVAVLILLQLFLLLFALVELGTRQYWVSIAFKILSFLMVLCILPREDNPSYKISWIILIMAVPLVGGIFYLMFGMKRNSRHMARQIERYTRTLLHRDDGQQLLAPKAASAPLDRLEQNNPMLGRQAGYIQNSSGFMLYENTEASISPAAKPSMNGCWRSCAGPKSSSCWNTSSCIRARCGTRFSGFSSKSATTACRSASCTTTLAA